MASGSLKKDPSLHNQEPSLVQQTREDDCMIVPLAALITLMSSDCHRTEAVLNLDVRKDTRHNLPRLWSRVTDCA